MILAGDIGGTKARLALFQYKTKRLTIVREKVFGTGAVTGPEEAILKFLENGKSRIRIASLGVAGPVFGGRCEMTNLSWVVDADRIRKTFRIPRVLLLNDLQAMAYGTLFLARGEYAVLNPGRLPFQHNRAVIAAGTGLGEAVLFWDGAEHHPAASEGGNADFAPRRTIEIRLLEFLMREHPRVRVEHVLSGPGLVNIYRFLKETGGGKEPGWLAEKLAGEDPAAVITEAALNRKAGLCVRALDLFISVYGSEAGNLAIRAMATGGVYLGGGIALKILDRLSDGSFMKGFLAGRRYASWMSRIPIRVILNPDAALIGAARFGLRTLE